jgi:predicted O-linked N-acetylglucosamine transferase (SPINDLY family)
LCQEIREFFSGRGIAEGRIDLIPHITTTRDHLTLYREIDIALDTFPYSGITTTCEALWMGVPVIALRGRNQVSRLCTAVLHAADRPDLATENETEYADKADALASGVEELRSGRSAFRRRIKQSALMDETGFAANLERALREIWRRDGPGL